VDVRDVVAVMKQLAESDISGERYIVSAENLFYREIFSKIALETGKMPPAFRANRLMGQLAWRLSYLQGKLTGTKPLITRETALTAGNTYQYSNQKIKKLLNYPFLPVELAIKDACMFYLNNKP
jgi:nucleoside-diphosphate-sugar epimerase